MIKENKIATLIVVSIVSVYVCLCMPFSYGENGNKGITVTVVNEYQSSPSTASNTTRYGQFINDTYISNVQNLEGYTRLKGLIVSDNVPPGGTYFNQLVGGNSVSNWHGTDTVNYQQIGGIYRGEIDIPIWGRYGRLTINGFGTSTFASVNLYLSNETIRETAGKWTVSIYTVGTTTAQIAPQSSSRKNIIILNEGTNNDLFIAATTPVDPNVGSFPVYKNKGYWSDEFGRYYEAFYGITLTGTTTVRVMELK